MFDEDLFRRMVADKEFVTTWRIAKLLAVHRGWQADVCEATYILRRHVDISLVVATIRLIREVAQLRYGTQTEEQVDRAVERLLRKVAS